MPRRLVRALTIPLLTAAACSAPDAGRRDPLASAYLALVEAEDRRPAEGPDLARLVDATAAPHPVLRATAVRGLGRLEDPSLVSGIAPLLRDPDPRVRREAANALAQAVLRGDGAPALPALLAAGAAPDGPTVLASVARSLGRVRAPAARRAEVALALAALSRGPDGDAPPLQMEGVVQGMASFVARLGGDPPPLVLTERLRELTRYGAGAPAWDEGAARVRAMAVGAWLTVAVEGAPLESFLADPSAVVRRGAAARLGTLPAPERERLAALAGADPAAPVRIEAVRRGWGVPPLSTAACGALRAHAEGDPDPHVRLAALDALGSPCPNRPEQVAFLVAAAGGPDEAPADWHEAGHALAALAGVDPGRAGPLLQVRVGHPNPFARAWAVRAAARAADTSLLAGLVDDPDPNVRTEALAGLAALEGRAADPILIAALAASDDNQLLLTVAGLLEGIGTGTEATTAALDALARITRPGWETLRDARLALLDLVGETGDATHVARVEPYLRDQDGAVAQRAADVLLAWTGQRWIAAPRGSPRLAPPSVEELRAMERCSVVFHMARGGSFEVRLLPWEAPTNAVRLWRMASEGRPDGLTLHRVVPNFVIQGLSPAANEYAGHGAFTRDEVGLASNVRGTVGVSTRGRDTGDGQIYVNLVDNVRLDHDYTVFGVVVEGMEVVDAVLEGDPVERVEVRPAARHP